MDFLDVYNCWITEEYFDDDTKSELKAISNDKKEIEERFFKDLEFGTGGLRGIIGAGTNRLNIYTIRRATQGLANYLLKQESNAKEMGVAIAYDSRRYSKEFATQTALVLNGNGIKTYLFDELRPVPELSFAVRELGCAGGIVITASHNPPEYNGYKVYGADGGQVPYPLDEEIIKEVNLVTDFSKIKLMEENEGQEKGLFNIIGSEIDEKYIKVVKEQAINVEVIKKEADLLNIVYTPLHGTGNKPVYRALTEIGFNKVHVVEEQKLPDSNFSTIKSPNPEDPKVFEMAMKLADKVNADIVLGTDPDADRVGAVVKNSNGEYVVLTGNMTGVLIAEYILSQKKKANILPENGAIISTLVSTRLAKVIAKSYDTEYFEVLTGFKYIGKKIKEFEETGSHKYLFGFEESYGCLPGTYARDKDAVAATLLICEIAAYYKSCGMTIYEGLLEIYKKYGFYKESIESINLKGIEGLQKISKIMNSFRENVPSDISGLKVLTTRDYKQKKIKNLETGEQSEIDLPPSDVLYYELENDCWICIRPSGTEPKLKVYFGSKGTDEGSALSLLENLRKDVMNMIEKI